MEPLLCDAPLAVVPLPLPVAAPALAVLEPPLDDGPVELVLTAPPLLSQPGSGDPDAPHAMPAANITAADALTAVLSNLPIEAP